MYLTISLFLEDLSQPLACLISQSIVFGGGQVGPSLDADWTQVIFKVTGFLIGFCFIVLGTYIAYYKTVIKVDTMKKVRQIAYYSLVAYVVVGAIRLAFSLTIIVL